MRISYLLPCLWTAASIRDSGLEISPGVSLHPRAVLPHHPQRVQDLPHIQCEQHPKILVMKDLTTSSSTFVQPTEFNGLNHERTFKLILAGLLVFILLYVSAWVGIVWHFDWAGTLFEVGDAVITPEAGMSILASWIFRGSLGVTALSILTSIACGVYANRGFVTASSNPPNGLLQVNIPFSTLHLAIAVGIVVFIVLNIVFHFEGVGGIGLCSILQCILLCNNKARNHVGLRFRQLIDRFTIGGNNSFDPFVSLALVVRALIVRFTVGGHNAVAPNVSIALDGGDQVAQVAPQLSTRRWAVPSDRYAVTLPEFLNVMDVTETSM